MSDPQWDVLEKEGVREVIGQASRRVHRAYGEYVELEDLQQEATIFVVTKKDLIDVADELGMLQYRLEFDLIDKIKYDAAKQSRQIPYQKIEDQEQNAEGTFTRGYVAIATATNDYTRESVESLLPAIWDESMAYGLPRKDTAPDPDMPRSTPNKSHGNTLSAYIADIKTGWDRSNLTLNEKRVLLLAYGFGWSQKQIAFNQSCAQSTVSTRIYTGIGKIVARLNGGLWSELEGEAA